ncbi:MAG TPA: 4Fe-4S dicluster domain-containing protein [Anaerolineaceae bacterium]|nr:4Fe-4S dicluster domain-containing protein [Anaerolineales bacterium]HOG57910.1 4Fe-4S dicluster domain-containing protein [Anaerolineaceae bacterium]HOR83757.1 4Fe-4S dicluster domain-containing protein [Anaerolineaceae bacterium]HOT52860.1 4Fe-4S dicluster domain-containing protein [Anaerolineaceae bacterium]HPL42719.1 4Fe-4S dicluster domain-containing protein [Anaerolineaceae bacterium]
MALTSTSKYAYIECDPNLCVGCQLCEYMCSFTKTGEYNSFRSRIRTVRVDEVLISAIACRTCENAPCVIVCPRDALTQDPDLGIIRVDSTKCDGCAWCVEACDFGAISINPATTLAEICDLCETHPEGPQCVKWCPKEALTMTTADQRAQRNRKKLIAEALDIPTKASDPK